MFKNNPAVTCLKTHTAQKNKKRRLSERLLYKQFYFNF
jgi:hypothetical protein